jgi:UDP-glucose 4-epimerase
MKAIVTGAAGFIGSNLTDRLLLDGHHVLGIDNLSTGRRDFLLGAIASPHFALEQIDLLDLNSLKELFAGADAVFHLAANADVRFGPDHPDRDLRQNTIATWNVLEAMRANNVKRIAFSSTGSVYGEATVIPTPEDAPFPIQTSLYGASKLAAEGLIAAYCEAFGMTGHIFRFVSILGARYTHGHVFDFYKQLLTHPDRLKVLGDGTQRKSYLEVRDCVSAILTATERATNAVNVFNLGTSEYCTVRDSIGWICSHLGLTPEIEFGSGNRGWIGDNPFIFLENARIRSLDWRPEFTIEQGVRNTVAWLQDHQHVLLERN